jgi:hypothetical protein
MSGNEPGAAEQFPAYWNADVEGLRAAERAQVRLHALIGDVGPLSPLGRSLGVIEDSVLNSISERAAALALADQRAGEIATLRAALTDYRDRIANITSGWGEHLPRDVMYSLSTSHYSVAALLNAVLSNESNDYEDVLRQLDPVEFRRQYEGTWEPPGPLSDAELERMERRHYKGNEDAYRLTMEVRRQRGVIDALLRAVREVEWLPGPDYAHAKIMECPCCLHADYQGHTGDCLIGRALTAAGDEGERDGA